MAPTDILRRAHYIPLLLGLAYAAGLALLTIPAIQRELLFLHHVTIPLFPDLTNPEKYGLAPYKTRNLRLNTSDGESIGAWHILPRSIYHSLDPFPPRSRGAVNGSIFDQALSDRPTIIYFHGNAGNRAVSHRVRSYSALSNSLDCNVLAVDYRGFGDSSGTPSETGLLIDARTVFDFVIDTIEASRASSPSAIDGEGEQAKRMPQTELGKAVNEKRTIADQVILIGQSLGTGVVSGLAGRLTQEEIYPRALVLIAPFTSITELLTSYRLFRFVPLLGPLAIFPSIQRFFQSFLLHPFDSRAALMNTTSPTLLLHAINDHTIPHFHSSQLFSSLHQPKADTITTYSTATSTIAEITYDGWGVVRSFDREDKGEVVWWEGREGGHDNIGWAEGTLDLIARISRL